MNLTQRAQRYTEKHEESMEKYEDLLFFVDFVVKLFQKFYEVLFGRFKFFSYLCRLI